MLGTLALSLFLSWVQVSSETYIVKSSAGEERAKRVLTELERFHQLVGTLVFRNTELPELPIEVLLIGDEQTLKDSGVTLHSRVTLTVSTAPNLPGKTLAGCGYRIEPE